MNNWVEVDEGALAGNFRAVQAVVGAGVEVLAVVKADAYGHGVSRCAAALVRAGARWLGVTCASEGVRVRELVGPGTDILVMCGFLAEDVPALVSARLVPVVWTLSQVQLLRGRGMRVQVEVDTGMGRQGCRVSELSGVLAEIKGAGLVVDGVFTHYCCSEEGDGVMTRVQQGRFAEAIAVVEAAGVRVGWVHVGNTSSVDHPVNAGWLERMAARVGARAMVRTGIGLFGYTLPAGGVLRAAVQPVMTWKAKVLAVRELEAGETVGYGGTFRAERAMRVALVAVGYADGLQRAWSYPAGWMMVRGVRAHVLGRVSMNLTVVDVTGTDGVCAGEEVVVLGPGVTADDHARVAGTIAYEILCGVKPCG